MINQEGFLKKKLMLELIQSLKKLSQNLMNTELLSETIIVLEKNLGMQLKIIRKGAIIQ